MQLNTLLTYPTSKLLNLNADQFAMMFSAALSHLNTTKDLMITEKNSDIIAYRRKQIEKINATLATLRMHQHYQEYQNQVSALNIRTSIAA